MRKIDQPLRVQNQIPLARRILYGAVVSMLLLAAFFVVAEGILWLTKSGYDTNFFAAANEKHVTTNPFFLRRFFGDKIEPRSTNIIHFLRDKPAKNYRIFVLGGSAAMGVPAPAFSFSRFLQVMLELAYPEHEFEVINTAMTSINSHVVRDITQECTEYDPDLFIVYLGNNEVVGPFGPVSVFESLSGNLWAIRASLLLKKTYVGQWLNDLFGNAVGTTGWDGMQMFVENKVSADDARLARVYRQFAANLISICRSAEQVGAKVLLCSVAVNLRDCPPFSVSQSPNEKEQKISEDLVQQISTNVTESGHYSVKWIKPLQKQLDANPQDALLHYLLGHCYLAAGENQLASDSFTRARNFDLLRFRADSKINEIIHDIARVEAKRGVSFVDVEKSLNKESPAGISGSDYFYEHVHFTPRGQYAVAQTLFKVVCAQLPGEIRTGDRNQPKVASYNTCAIHLALTDLEKLRAIKENLEMTTKPPFVYQHFHHRRASKQRAALAALDNTLIKEQEWMRVVYLGAAQQKPHDLVLQFLAARFLLSSGRTQEALPYLTTLAAKIPNNHQMHLLLGSALYKSDKRTDAEMSFQKALAESPDQAMTLSDIAAVHLRAGRIPEAINCAELAHALQPSRINTTKLLAIIHFNANNLDQATKLFESIYALRDDDQFVVEKLIFLCMEENENALAANYAKGFLEKHPNNSLIRTYYAIALRNLGDLDLAAREYKKILTNKLDNNDPLKIDISNQYEQILKSIQREK